MISRVHSLASLIAKRGIGDLVVPGPASVFSGDMAFHGGLVFKIQTMNVTHGSRDCDAKAERTGDRMACSRMMRDRHDCWSAKESPNTWRDEGWFLFPLLLWTKLRSILVRRTKQEQEAGERTVDPELREGRGGAFAMLIGGCRGQNSPHSVKFAGSGDMAAATLAPPGVVSTASVRGRGLLPGII